MGFALTSYTYQVCPKFRMRQIFTVLSLPSETVLQILNYVDINDIWSLSQAPTLGHYIHYSYQANSAEAIVRNFVQHIVHTHHSYALSFYLQRQLAHLHEQYPIATLLQTNLALTLATSVNLQPRQVQSITTFLITNATSFPEIPLADSFIYDTFEAMCDMSVNTTSCPRNRKPLIDTLARLVFEMPIRSAVGEGCDNVLSKWVPH